MENKHRFPYKWNLSDGYPAKGIEKHGLKVFGTFICGGGSSMGYKLAGYEHLGGVELDASIAAIYKENHDPKYLFAEDIRDFNKRENLPPELYNLDVLDGSPPCSTFSMAGKREKGWGVEKVFAEGQKHQRLDDLVFAYCETILKLKPKVFILENVAGLVRGNAKAYVREILKRLSVEYVPQVYLLNAASMGVPQRRERTFIIGHRKDIKLPPLKLNFNEAPILFREIQDKADPTENLSPLQRTLWEKRQPNDMAMADIKAHCPGIHVSDFGTRILHSDTVAPTLATKDILLYDFPRKINKMEVLQVSSFPLDYATNGKHTFLCGMSVPPIMTAQIAYEIYLQWFKK